MNICAECHGTVKDAGEFHPYLYCELVKLGHHQPEAYLASYGFVRAVPSPVSDNGDEGTEQ